ncbi:MAG: YdcF family protein [Alphaproteobacteria bacterium]|nr:YdcF family protein [Alphaproteobacteria bacterium]
MTVSVGGYVLPSEENPDRLNAIERVMFPKFPETAITDVCVVFGAGVAGAHLAEQAATLFRNGLVKTIILAGGPVINDLSVTEAHKKRFSDPPFYPEDGETEAEYMARILIEKGVPEEALVLEKTSKNTGENARAVIALEAYENASSVHVVAFSATRTLMTLRREEQAAGLAPKPAILTQIIPLRGGWITAKNWRDNETGRNIILREFRKIDPTEPTNYIKQGFCSDVALQEEIKRAESLPKMGRPLCSFCNSRMLTAASSNHL